MRRRVLNWSDVEALLEHLIPQIYGSFDAMVMISRGGLIPGGLIAERLNLTSLYTAAVRFPAESSPQTGVPIGDRPLQAAPPFDPPTPKPRLGLPHFLQFPDDALLRGKRTLVVYHVWNHGRMINAVAGRVAAARGSPELCVFHYKPTRSIFPDAKPDYFAAITSDYIVYPWEVGRRLEPYRPMPEPR